MGKWSTYRRRGGSNFFGVMAAPGVNGVDWLAETGVAGGILLSRLASIPAGATQMLWRVTDTVTGTVSSFAGAGSFDNELVAGRSYRVQASWFNGSRQVSGPSPADTIAAGT